VTVAERIRPVPHHTPMDTARLTVSRTDHADVQQRQVIVSLGEGRTATLLFGESVDWDLAPGDHVLRANNTLVWKKVPFSLAAGEHAHFSVVNRASRFTLGFLSLMGVAPLYLTVERRPSPSADLATERGAQDPNPAGRR
jgi:hypothetical protein